MVLPICDHCGNEVFKNNNIWQLTDMPDLITEGEGDKYIGYEHIGKNYSGARKYLMEERDILFAEEVARVNGDGIFLDLACGDGCFTVPCARNGFRIIAGDISNAMMGILQEKARYNHVSLEHITLCRMNILELPLVDESVHTVVANSVLHLISNPQKVIDEIYRVLKKGGVFICLDDQPGKTPEKAYDNQKYYEIVNDLYGSYWNKLQMQGIKPKKYSWKFNRAEYCEGLFSTKSEKLIERGNPYRIRICDGFLPRFAGRGFSDQTDVPKEIHDKVMEELMEEFGEKYGASFVETAVQGMEDDMLVTFYKK